MSDNNKSKQTGSDDAKQVVVLAESASVPYLVLPLPASRELSDGELDSVGGGTYSAWFTCLKSCADSKGQVQGELARFR